MPHDGTGEHRVSDTSAFGVVVNAGGLAPSLPPSIPDHELIRRIGTGSYGEVWLARSAVGTYRAAKIVYRRSFENERPFEREFRGIQKFEPISRSHEGLVDVLQIGRNDADGYFYYIMELADDANVGQASRLSPQSATIEQPSDGLVRNNATKSFGTGGTPVLLASATYVPRTLKSELTKYGRLPFDRCVEVGLALTNALDHIHGQGLVHRDIKPSNIIFVNGVPKLADIGLVADTSEAKSFVGTLGFIPPEGPGTPQADLYSLGKVLYEISTGKDRQDFPQLPADLRELPTADTMIEFNEILLMACELEPRRRYQSAGQMCADLELLQGGQSVRHRRAIQRGWAVVKWVALLTISASVMGACIVASIRYLGIRARANSLTLSAPAARPLLNRVSQNAEADNEFWLGWNSYKRGTAAGVQQGWEHFNRAIALDPKCLAAYNGLFEVLLGKPRSLTGQEADALLRATAKKLMELDNTMAEAHAAQALIDHFDWKWEQAERGFKKAIQLNPDCAIARMRYGFWLTFMGRPDEALPHLRLAEELDPILPLIRKNIGNVFFVKRQFTNAIEQYNKILKLEPDSPVAHNCLGSCYLALGEFRKAIDELVQAKLGYGEDPAKVEEEADERRKALAESGPHGFWEKVLEHCKASDGASRHYRLAECYVGLGRIDDGFDELNASYEDHERDFPSFAFFEPMWEPYRDDERFQTLLRKAGLAK